MTPPPAPSQAHPAPGSRAPPQKKRKLEDEQPEMGGTNVVPPRQESAPAFVATPSFLGKGAIRGEEQPARSAGGTSGFAALLQGAGPGGGSSGGGGPKPGGLANPFLQASARPAADVSEQQRQLALLMQLMPQANAMGGPAAFPPGMFPPFLFPGMMPMLMGGLGQGGIPPQMVRTAPTSDLWGTEAAR